MKFPNRQEIQRRQLVALRELGQVLSNNPFYAAKFSGGLPNTENLAAFVSSCPLTRKIELVADQQNNPPFGSNHSYPIEHYSRYHQTSGSSGSSPIRWLDTSGDWQAMMESWGILLSSLGMNQADRCFFAFSFGPFLGFWTAFEAALKLGCLCIPGGGMGTSARLKTLIDSEVTTLFCTPTYAIHMGQTARAQCLDLGSCCVKRILVAGEPGGSLPKTRALIQSLWPGASVYDHHGMTEVGPVSLPCSHVQGLHIMEHAYFPEVVDPETGNAVAAGEAGELILTCLNRSGAPLLRYCTGDLVRPSDQDVCACGRADMALDGGILGRIDDMVVVRGVNLYPSAVEELVRKFSAIEEYQVIIRTGSSLSQVTVSIEVSQSESEPELVKTALAETLKNCLHLRVDVLLAPPNRLPRFELKARRWKIIST